MNVRGCRCKIWGKFGKSSEKVRRKSRKIKRKPKKVRRTAQKSSEKQSVGLNETQRQILEIVQKNNRISASAMAKELLLSSRGIEKNIKLLREQGILVRHGSPKGGYWEIAE